MNRIKAIYQSSIEKNFLYYKVLAYLKQFFQRNNHIQYVPIHSGFSFCFMKTDENVMTTDMLPVL